MNRVEDVSRKGGILGAGMGRRREVACGCDEGLAKQVGGGWRWCCYIRIQTEGLGGQRK